MPLNNSNFLHAMQVCVHKAVGFTKIWRNLWLDVFDLYNIIIEFIKRLFFEWKL